MTILIDVLACLGALMVIQMFFALWLLAAFLWDERKQPSVVNCSASELQECLEQGGVTITIAEADVLVAARDGFATVEDLSFVTGHPCAEVTQALHALRRVGLVTRDWPVGGGDVRGWWVVYASDGGYLTPQFAVIATSEKDARDLAEIWAAAIPVKVGRAERLCDVPGEAKP